MLPDKIEITDKLRSIIQKRRHDLRISTKDLSMKHLGRSASYISALENGRLKSLRKNELLKIFEVLFNLDENSAAKKIESILAANENIDIKLSSNASNKNFSQDNIKKYQTVENHTDDKTLDGLMENMKEGFKTIQKVDPEFTISTLKRLVTSMHFDLGFMMALFHIPFFALEGLSHDERQQFLNDLSDIFKKYAVISKEHSDQQKENETNELEENSTNPDSDDLQAADTSSDNSD